MTHRILLALLTILTAACIDGQAATDRPGERTPATKVDSIVPVETALARFLAGATRPEGLSNGSASMNDLIGHFSDALEHQDSLGLMRMAVTRAEYGYF